MHQFKELENSYLLLRRILKEYERVCVGFSGGIDSTVLLAVAKEVLGEQNVIAVTARGIMTSEEAYQNAVTTAKNIGVDCITVEIDAFSIPEFVCNDKRRCYHCKKHIFIEIGRIAKVKGCVAVLEGSNLDDNNKYRPGKVAMQELGIESPLAKAMFTKEMIRTLAKELGLVEWNRPSESCLATRFPYDTKLTHELFHMVGQAEAIIQDAGISQCRVRLHDDIARIEVPHQFFEVFITDEKLQERIKQIGFRYITLDLEGFRSGSMD